MNIWEELHWRGLVADCTDPAALGQRTQPLTVYCGFDPTADSLHVGHLVPLLALRRFQLFGHHPIAVAGGATGAIGDPSGKSAERPLLSPEQIRFNLEAIRPQLARLLDFQTSVNPARLLDNADWTADVRYLDFLREIGKHFSINQMLAKESVRARLENRDTGLSYTEFSYMLLQAFDFYVLCRDYDCQLQIGGSDQWGNITAGIDLIRKKLGRAAYGLTLPLVTKADGTKFGKTESGSVWLDPRKTSPYRFYQFWINTDDRDVIRYLKYFTFLPAEEIAALETQHQQNPGARTAHRALARAVTELVHGPTATQEAVRASEVLFGGKLEGIPEGTFREIMDEVPTLHLNRTRLEGSGLPLTELLIQAGLATSKSQARKDIEAGGIYINNVREIRIDRAITIQDLLFGRHLLLRKGKKQYVLMTAE
ncbi:MAG: tyrosine--tRNA ligase [Verrucomicrobiota bacterium]|nr:tyrosine--tRNA ligase [Limisphaera sp.]MDW8382322.1 tyrosine--tRNA ligase [Verrucomicrobiota bacterium]